MKRRPVVIGGILVVAATVAALTLGVDRRPSPSSDYETVKVERGKIVARVTASGTLSALVTVQVGSQVSGRIQELYGISKDETEKQLSDWERRILESAQPGDTTLRPVSK